MPNQLQLILFGSPEVRLHGQPVTGFRTSKAQALLYYLAVTGRPHTRATLAGLLWGDQPEDAARASLSKCLSNLRDLLGDAVLIERQTVALNRDYPYDLDTERFAAIRQPPTVATSQALQAALAFYRGDLLEGFYVREAPDFEQWLLVQRAHYREAVINGLQALAAFHEQGGDLPSAITHTRRLLALEPWREEAHRQLMTWLARSGQRAAALAQFETCRRVLEEELAVEPDRETVQLYEYIKRNDVADQETAKNRSLSPLAASLSAPQSVTYNLPIPLTPLIGREQELAELSEMIRNPYCRLITILGPGGIGKTRLSIEIASRIAITQIPIFLHGVVFVPLAGVDTPARMISTLAQILVFTFQGRDNPEIQLVNHLRDKKMLLILDNFEQLINQESLSFFIKLLEIAPNVKLLITSRTRLNLHGEQIYWQQGLHYPDIQRETRSLTLAELKNYSAIHLLIEAIRRVHHDYAPPPSDIPPLITICRLVQGMPLALELAAVWTSMLSPVEIATEIIHNLDFLSSEAPNLPLRQRSIRAVFTTSWHLLTSVEQETFQMLSVFRGGFTREAAQTIISAAPNVLVSLVNKSFLHRTPTGRFEIHELLRQYAAANLNHSHLVAQTAHQHHSCYYAQRLAQWAIELKGGGQQAALLEMATESDNLRAAWEWAVEQRQRELIAQSIDGLGFFYIWHGRYQEGETAYLSAYERLKIVLAPSEEWRDILVSFLLWLGIFNRYMGYDLRAKSLLQEGLTRLNGVVDKTSEHLKAALFLELGSMSIESNRSETATLYQRSLALYQASGDEWGAAHAYLAQSQLERAIGEYDKAQSKAEEGLTIYQKLQDRRGIANALGYLSQILMDLGKFEQAERFTRQQIEIFEEIKDQWGIASGLTSLGLIDLFLGDFDESARLFRESLTILSDLGTRREVGPAHNWLANTLCMQRQYAEARLHAQTALIYAQEDTDLWGAGHTHMTLGWVELGMETYTKAQQYLQTSVSLFEQIDQQDELSQSLAWLSYAELSMGNLAAGQQYLARSLHISTKVGTVLALWVALPAIALLLIRQGKSEQAVEIYTLVMRYPAIANSQLINDIAGKHVNQAAAALPISVCKAARERGKSRHLRTTAVELLAELRKFHGI